MKIIKSFTYNVVDTEPFELSLPIEFELMHGNARLAAYKVHENEQVDYSFSASADKKILTSTSRPLTLNDIYFLFSSRVFSDKSPFAQAELERFGVSDYNPYEIIRRTHGIMPGDRYWLKFAGEDFTFKQALARFNEYYKPEEERCVPEESELPCGGESVSDKGEEVVDDSATIHSFDSIMAQRSHEFSSMNDVGSILGAEKLDVHSLINNIDKSEVTDSVFAKGQPTGFTTELPEYDAATGTFTETSPTVTPEPPSIATSEQPPTATSESPPTVTSEPPLTASTESPPTVTSEPPPPTVDEALGLFSPDSTESA
ncbi:MAG: hypothetical protein FWG45_07065 [Oscillospiraceae bacterium]|nr:hypothetical protein [Oscillospiraceae bacterium]